MKNIDRGKLLAEINDLAIFAGKEILSIYHRDLKVRKKSDNSPVTEADEAAEKIILAGLRRLTPNIPVVAEEEVSKGNLIDVGDNPFWLVDPLDGTKEFIANRNEYTVNIGLIENTKPTMGVVFAPALDQCFSADGPGTAIKCVESSEPQPINARELPKSGLIVTTSRSHSDPREMSKLLKNYISSKVLVSGSSIKFCLIASGEADIYPRYGPTNEWDTAAGHAILAAAGGSVKTIHNDELTYGKDKFKNPEFIAYGNKTES